MNLEEEARTGDEAEEHEPSETSDDEEELDESATPTRRCSGQRAESRRRTSRAFSLSDDQKQALQRFEKGIPRLLDNMSLYSNTAVLEQAIADVCGEPQLESSVNKKLFEVILEKARTVLDLLEKHQEPLHQSSLEDMWVGDDDDDGIRGFLLEEFAKDAANLETAVLYDRNVALHMGSEEAAAEAGPPPGRASGPQAEEPVRDHISLHARGRGDAAACSQLRSSSSSICTSSTEPWKSSNPAHERRCIEMCKLAHGSAYVDKMFEKLSAKEAKPGSDRLSDASVPPHGKKVPKGKGDTKVEQGHEAGGHVLRLRREVRRRQDREGRLRQRLRGPAAARPPPRRRGPRARRELARLLFYEWRRDRRRVLFGDAPRRACDDHRL